MAETAWDELDEPPTAMRRPPGTTPGTPSGTMAAPRLARRLVVIEGPDRGATFALDPDAPSRILLGTSPVCDVHLSDPTVSRRHIAFEPDEGRLRVTDLDTTNGTVVDGTAILQAYLRGGETIRCGSTVLRLETTAPADVRGAAADAPLPDAERLGSMLGASRAMRRLYPLCERIARSRVPAILEGETGTGKEALAESLHELSGVTGPFVVFDCTAVSPSLVEAELFGHEKGAFTGAVAARPGVFEQAQGGTLLIDEIGDLDLALQAKLLRVVDRGELRRVGGGATIKVDVRLLAATRRDLDHEVSAGRFRDDLFHRIAVARIELPPLRERRGDVTLLARHFAAALGGALSDETLARFEDYPWPGNVRELRNAVARCFALGEESFTMPSSPPPSSPGAAPPDWLDAVVSGDLPFVVARRRALDEFERRYIERVLDKHGGNATEAAHASGIALRYFHQVKARAKKAQSDPPRPISDPRRD